MLSTTIYLYVGKICKEFIIYIIFSTKNLYETCHPVCFPDKISIYVRYEKSNDAFVYVHVPCRSYEFT